MRLERNRLNLWQKHLIYVLTVGLLLTGLVWLVLDRFVHIEGDFGPEKHAAQYPALLIHGFMSFAYLLLLGSVLAQHVWRGWAIGLQRPQALILLLIQFLLVVTAPLLLYVAHERLREFASDVHLIAGLALALMLPVHIYLCRRAYLVDSDAADAVARTQPQA